jgi:hypothetical protein
MAEAQKTQPAHSLFTITQEEEEEEAYPHSHHQRH